MHEWRRLAMAMLADVMEALGAHPGAGDRYVATFMPHMLMGCMSTDLELRQAALFGVGLCAQHGGAGFGPYRSEALQTLMHVMGQPQARSDEHQSATDNAAASLGKIAQFQPQQAAAGGVGEDTFDIFASWLAYLPLRGDVQESVVVNRQLAQLVEANHAPLLGPNAANLPRIMCIFAEVLETELVDEETVTRIQGILRSAQAAAPAQLEGACRGLPAEGVAKLQRAIAGTSLSADAAAAGAGAGGGAGGSL